MNNFDDAVQFVLQAEGGYSNDPVDPGGETNFGISKRSHPTLDIKNLTKEQAIEIYRKEYWDGCGCNDLDYPMNVMYFDTCVNMGKGQADKFIVESKTAADFTLKRLYHYKRIVDKNPKMKIYLIGWFNRVLALYGKFSV